MITYLLLETMFWLVVSREVMISVMGIVEVAVAVSVNGFLLQRTAPASFGSPVEKDLHDSIAWQGFRSPEVVTGRYVSNW